MSGGHVHSMFEFGPGSVGNSEDRQLLVDRMYHVVTVNAAVHDVIRNW